MFKLFLLISTILKLYLQSFTLENQVKTLDRGLANSNSEEKENKNEESSSKMYLYQRVKMEFNQNSTIFLHYGLNNQTFTSGSILDFNIDLGYSEILINLNSKSCRLIDNCHRKIENTKRNIDFYKGNEISNFDAKIFLGVNRIRPGTLHTDKNEELQHFYNLPVKFYDNFDSVKDNILGLSPNSPIWKYWKDIYNFPNKHINITICYNQEHEYVLYDSYIDMEKEILFRVEKKSPDFKFKAVLNYNDNKFAVNNQDVNVCISNEKNLSMKLTRSIMDHLKNSLCKNPQQCEKASDLNENVDINFQIKMEDHLRKDNFFSTKFYMSSFYYLVGNEIVWKIDNLSEKEEISGCEIIFEQEFLKEKYLLISNNIDDEEYIYVGFKLILPSDFSKFDFYSISIIIISIVAVSLFIVFFVLNNSLNKLIEKEDLKNE